MADRSSSTSVRIAGELLDSLGITQQVEHVGQTAGMKLEEAVERHLKQSTQCVVYAEVSRRAPITHFVQYEHLALLAELIERDETNTLKAAIGADYIIKPDVTVGLQLGPEAALHLHAAVPCKWTLRSDRAQNIRHEAVVLIRTRRGRLPHIAPVTAEPLPTRLASLARGTGEVDAVYHVALDELRNACALVGNREQIEVLEELVDHGRLRDLSTLASTISN
jgi:predicted DNA-binding protein